MNGCEDYFAHLPMKYGQFEILLQVEISHNLSLNFMDKLKWHLIQHQ